MARASCKYISPRLVRKKSYVTSLVLPKPKSPEEFLRARVLSIVWFPLFGGRRFDEIKKWIFSQAGIVGSTWDRRPVWNSGGRFEFWGIVPQRAMKSMQANRTCAITAIDPEKHRVRLRMLSTGALVWKSVEEFVHMWRLASLGRKENMPKGVKRKRIPAAIAGMKVLPDAALSRTRSTRAEG